MKIYTDIVKILQEILQVFINEYSGNVRTEIMSRITRALRYEQQVHYSCGTWEKKGYVSNCITLPSLPLVLFLNKFSNKGETYAYAKS